MLKKTGFLQMIIVFGSMNIDMVMPVERFPNPGETVLCATDYLSRPGGKGANQAVAAVRAGAKVAIVGQVGDDAFGRRSVNNLKTQSIWTSGIGTSTRPTGCSTIAVDRYGENIVIVAPGANLDAKSDQVPDEIFNKKNIILTQLEVDPKEAFSVLARARKKGTPTILNAAPAERVTAEALKNVDYLILNEVEAVHLVKNLGIAATTPQDMAKKITALGSKGMVCIITLDARGSVAVQDGQAFIQPAPDIEAVDTTGAGDAFCGIFAACLLAGKTWRLAMRYASAGASLSCLGLGAQAGMPFMEDIEAALPRVPEAVKD